MKSEIKISISSIKGRAGKDIFSRIQSLIFGTGIRKGGET